MCHVLRTPEEVERLIERQPLWNDQQERHGPFDIIGDVHGCCDELRELLAQLGYTSSRGRTADMTVIATRGTQSRLRGRPGGSRAAIPTCCGS